ncbi:MAG: hypothetical protein MJ097_07840 [Dorea sp.]|nr:hypothetical protein [Dorea sp.]
MAILLIKIENKDSLAFNEFYDYFGNCYASTTSREKPEDQVIDMANFYEATVSTETIKDVPVVFVTVEKEQATILGWYKKAEIFKEMKTPSFFLEGNVLAKSSDVVWLPEEEPAKTLVWFAGNRFYEVIEEEDVRYEPLKKLIAGYHGKNQMIRYHAAETFTQAGAMKDVKLCKTACEQWASYLIEEKCRDIRDIKTLEAYAKKLCEKEAKNPDGYYYLALAYYHLGFVKDGIKQINRALKLEPEASDLLALKGMLLVSRGYAEDGAMLLHEAYEKSHDETYLLTEGRAYMMAGKVDKAYDCFKLIEDKSLLDQMNIKPKDMEKKWNFIKVRYMKFLDRFGRK